VDENAVVESTHRKKVPALPENPKLPESMSTPEQLNHDKFPPAELAVRTLYAVPVEDPSLIPPVSVNVVPEIAPDDATEVHPTDVAPLIAPASASDEPEIVFEPAMIPNNRSPDRLKSPDVVICHGAAVISPVDELYVVTFEAVVPLYRTGLMYSPDAAGANATPVAFRAIEYAF
jgi:hypothetical protein